MAETVIVIPNHLGSLDFLKSWEELKLYPIIVVQDIGKKPPIPKGFNVTIYDHQDIEADLGEDAWIIPTRSSACRSYGYYKAWQLKPEVIITLDNDCFPERQAYFVLGHQLALSTNVPSRWIRSAPGRERTRGYPYEARQGIETYINHGLWSNIPDLDAPTQLAKPDLRFKPSESSSPMFKGMYYPHCGMNFAWRAEATPLLYFGLQGPDYPFDRMDDIWAGVIMKKIADHLDWGVRSGTPSVEHRKQSNVYSNLIKEAPGIEVNEYFWQKIDAMTLTTLDPLTCYAEIAEQITGMDKQYAKYWQQLSKAMKIWINLFSV